MEETPHDLGLHAEDEKRSVLKKVKDKAKKLKDTLKLHGHGHNHHEEGHVPDDHDLDEEKDDKDEEMAGDPEIHGAYGATKSSELGHEKRSPAMEGTDPMNPQLKVAVERTSGIKEVPRAPTNTPASITPGIVQAQEVSAKKPELNPEGLTCSEEDPHAPKDRPGDYIPSNYQSKVADPTGAGGEAACISQVLRSLDKVSVSGDGEQGSKQILSTGSHDQISPAPIKQDNTQEPGTRTGQETSTTATLPVDYGKRVATAMTAKLGPVYEKVAEAGHRVTEKLSPVYQKVSEAGSTVLSKVHGNEEAKRLSEVHGNEEANRGIEGQDKGVPVKPELNLEGLTSLEEDPHAPKDRPGDYIPSNYQSKVADSTGAGGEAAGISQVLRSRDKVSVYSDGEQGSKQILSTGSHDQISPEPIKQDNTQEPGTRTGQETPPHAPKDQPGDYIPSNYQSKVTDPTGTGGEVEGVSQVLRSLDKVSVFGDGEQGSKQILSTGSHDQISPEPIKQDSTQEPGTRTGQETPPHALKDRPGDYIPSNYQSKVADPTGAGGEVAGVSQVLRSLDKVSVSGDGVQGSKQILSTGSHDQISPEPIKQNNTQEPGTRTGQETPHAPRDRPGDYIPSNYQSKVADPTGAGGEVAGVSQVFRSLDKVGVSGDGEQGSKQILSTGSHDQIPPEPIKQDNTQEPGTRTGQETSRTDTLPVDYGKRVATTMTEKLGPVYEKVAEAGHMVTEKLSPVYQKVSEAGSTVLSKVHGNEEAKRGIEGQEKGVSVKDYIAEKFRPREEDKALSEVISDALHKRRERTDETEQQIGKVTESEEVRRQLGSHSDASYEEGKVPSSAFIPRKGVVGKVKGAVGSWFGKGGEESRPSQQSLGSSTGPEGFSTSAAAEIGERRLQEAGN